LLFRCVVYTTPMSSFAFPPVLLPPPPADPSYTTTKVASDFICPMGIAIDDDDNVFVCEGGMDQIVKIDKYGKRSVFQLTAKVNTDNNPKYVRPDNLTFPEAIVFRNDYMYVMDGNNTIYKVDRETGIYESYATIIGHYLGFAIGDNGDLYYSSLDYPSETAKDVVPRIFKVTRNGVSNELIDLSGKMVYPGGLAVSGNILYVADMGGNTVGKINLKMGTAVESVFITLNPANNPTFNPNISVAENYADKVMFNPYAGCQCNIALAKNGDLIVVANNDHQGNNRVVYRYSSEGKLVSVISTVEEGLDGPLGVTVKKNGDVYVTNQVGGFVSVIKKKYDKHDKHDEDDD